MMDSLSAVSSPSDLSFGNYAINVTMITESRWLTPINHSASN